VIGLLLATGAGTPWTLGEGNAVVGMFRPLSVGLGPVTEASTTGLVSFLAPRVEVKRTLLTSPSLGVAGSVELSFPTYGLRQLQTGFLQLVGGDQHVPVAFVPGVGAWGGWRNEDWCVGLGLVTRVGVKVGDSDLRLQDLVWIDTMITPLTEGWSLQPRLRVDWSPFERWLFTAAGRAEVAAGPFLIGRLFALRSLADHVAIGAGAAGALANYSDGWQLKPRLFTEFAPEFDLQVRW